MPLFKNIQIDFRVSGAKGDIKLAVSRPVMSFTGLKLVAEDEHGGMGTMILAIFVDGQRVTPKIKWWKRLWLKFKRQSLGIPTVVFGGGVIGNGLGLPTCPARKEIAFEIEFLANGQWNGHLHGKGTVE